jgi:hypothetical protein
VEANDLHEFKVSPASSLDQEAGSKAKRKSFTPSRQAAKVGKEKMTPRTARRQGIMIGDLASLAARLPKRE